jgi:predicted N-acetyltransferase YhbS
VPPPWWPGVPCPAIGKIPPGLIDITLATAADQPAIETLLDACFGPARHNRTAYRLRDGATPIAGLSCVARAGGTIIGSLQCWDVALRSVAGARTPLILLGPVAVAAGQRGAGIASALMRHALAAADAAGAPPILLIGDEAFYGRFGFAVSATGGWIMPGPVDRARLLLRGDALALPGLAWVEGKDGLRRAA